MDSLTLRVCDPDGLLFEDKIISVTARTLGGDVQILKNHANYVTIISKGRIVIKTENNEIIYHCDSDGLLSVVDNKVRIFAYKLKK